MSNMTTINYYDSNAVEFTETTKKVDFSEIQQVFMSYLSPDASILDFGCGSGRDTKYFLDHGYHVTATDYRNGILFSKFLPKISICCMR